MPCLALLLCLPVLASPRPVQAAPARAEPEAPAGVGAEAATAHPELLALPVTLTGFVARPDGAPAEGALVVSSAGGKAVAGVDGAFTLEVALPVDALELQVTAAYTRGSSTQIGSLRVPTAQARRALSIGTLALGSSGTCQPEWLPTFGAYTDLRGVPFVLLVHDDGHGPALYAGGQFTGYVARLEGTRWTQLGRLDGLVRALAVFDEGSGPKLFAGGHFQNADGQSARGIARWDGTSWSVLGNAGPGPTLNVFTLMVHDDGSGPALYVGGDFQALVNGVPVNGMGRWSGTRWLSVSNGLTGRAINKLAVFDDGRGGGALLYAIETYIVGGSARGRIVRWDGASWSVFVDSFTPASTAFIGDMQTFDDGLGGGPALYIGGSFSQVAGVPARQAARWNGLAWSSLGSGPGIQVSDLAVVEDAQGRWLHACGNGGRVQRWNGTSWVPLPAMLTDADTLSLAGFDDGSGPALYACSAFTTFNDSNVYVSRYDGLRWSTVGSWLNNSVLALAVFDDGLGGGPALYAGGLFNVAGGLAARAVVKWDGTQWSALGRGMQGSAFRTSVQALVVHDDGRGPALFAGGEFVEAGGTSARNIARWDGLSWTRLGQGLNDVVLSLATFDDGLGAGPQLVAGGLFSASGSLPVARIARWNGTSWAPLASGTNNSVRALVVHDDGLSAGPALFAAGTFTTAGGAPANRIARWDGTAWSALGSGVDNFVDALAVFDDGLGGGPALYAGGRFTSAGGVPANRIARWNGLGWAPLGSGLNSFVEALEVFDDGTGPALYVGGSFSTAGGVAAARLARWDGTGWAPLGSGLGADFGTSEAFVTLDLGFGSPALVAGGGFANAGGTGDSFLGRWQGCFTAPPVITCPDPIVAGTFDSAGARVDFVVTATGTGSPPPTVTCVPPSGSLFPLGTTLVTCTAIDASGAQASCTFPVSVFRKAQRR